MSKRPQDGQRYYNFGHLFGAPTFFNSKPFCYHFNRMAEFIAKNPNKNIAKTFASGEVKYPILGISSFAFDFMKEHYEKAIFPPQHSDLTVQKRIEKEWKDNALDPEEVRKALQFMLQRTLAFTIAAGMHLKDFRLAPLSATNGNTDEALSVIIPLVITKVNELQQAIQQLQERAKEGKRGKATNVMPLTPLLPTLGDPNPPTGEDQKQTSPGKKEGNEGKLKTEEEEDEEDEEEEDEEEEEETAYGAQQTETTPPTNPSNPSLQTLGRVFSEASRRLSNQLAINMNNSTPLLPDSAAMETEHSNAKKRRRSSVGGSKKNQEKEG